MVYPDPKVITIPLSVRWGWPNGIIERWQERVERDDIILNLLCQGVRQREMAKQIGLAEESVNKLIQAMYRNLGLSNRQELIAWAARNGYGVGIKDNEQ